MPVKRDWIIRMVDLFHKLKIGVLYNKTNVRDVLKDECDDSISLPTTGELLEAIINAQNNGMVFKVGNKFRKLIKKETAGKDSLYELIEFDDLESIL
ncbi:MAG: hypothetical protein ACP6IY_17670 [Promethearchaeia archaeon]